MRIDDLLEKSLTLGKIEGRRRGCQRMRWLGSITNAMNMNFGQTPGDGEGQGGLVHCSPRGHKESDMTGLLNSNPHTWNFQFAPYFIKRQNKYNS